jgi:hypothetical protein
MSIYIWICSGLNRKLIPVCNTEGTLPPELSVTQKVEGIKFQETTESLHSNREAIHRYTVTPLHRYTESTPFVWRYKFEVLYK